jgi:hypothetical protein
MTIKFWYLWAVWAGGVVYDIAVSALKIFPNQSLRDRFLDDITIAWFIFIVWAAAWILHHWPARRRAA